MMSGVVKYIDKDGVCFIWQEDVCFEIYGRILCSLGEGFIFKLLSEVKIVSCLVKIVSYLFYGIRSWEIEVDFREVFWVYKCQ